MDYKTLGIHFAGGSFGWLWTQAVRMSYAEDDCLALPNIWGLDMSCA